MSSDHGPAHAQTTRGRHQIAATLDGAQCQHDRRRQQRVDNQPGGRDGSAVNFRQLVPHPSLQRPVEPIIRKGQPYVSGLLRFPDLELGQQILRPGRDVVRFERFGDVRSLQVRT